MNVCLRKFLVVCGVVLIASVLLAESSFAQFKVSPKKIKIIVKKIPADTVSLAVPLTFDTEIANISSVTTNVNGALAVFGQNGVGVVQTEGSLPAKVKFTVNFEGLKKGKTKITSGPVSDKIDGEPIEGAKAKVRKKKLKVK